MTAGERRPFRLERVGKAAVLLAAIAYAVWLARRSGAGTAPLEFAKRQDLAGLTTAVGRVGKTTLNGGDERGRTALHWATALRRPDLVRVLLDAGADPNAMDAANIAPLHLAVDRGDVELIALLTSRGADPNRRQRVGVSAFDLSLRRLPEEVRGNRQAFDYDNEASIERFSAGTATHTAIVKTLLMAGADPNGPFLPSGISPLNESIESMPTTQIAELLLDFKADPTRWDGSGRNALQVAVLKDRWLAFDVLLKRGTPVGALGGDQSTALHLAAERLSTNWVGRLLRERVNCNLRDRAGDTAFFAAFRSMRGRMTEGSTQTTPDERDSALFTICRQLLDAGLDVRQGDANGVTPLHLVVEHPACPIELVDLLLQRGADVNARDKYGETPAMHTRNGQMLPRLLARGADLDLESRLGFSVYRRASYRGDWTQFDYLLAASRRVWSDQSFRTRRLLDLLSNDRCPIDVADRLLTAGVGITLTTDGWTRHTALHLAARSGRLDLALRLIRAGANPNARDAVGKTPLHHAVERAFDNGLPAALVAAGADPDLLDAYGRTPVHCLLETAAEGVNSERRPAPWEVLQAIVELGANVDIGPASIQPDERVRPFLSPLELAVARELPEAVALLLQAGAAVNVAHPETGATALHLAAMQPVEHARMLLAAGADVNARDRRGRTPLHYAVARCADAETIRELLARGADVDLADRDGMKPHDIVSGRCDRAAYFNLHQLFEITKRRVEAETVEPAVVRAALLAPVAKTAVGSARSIDR